MTVKASKIKIEMCLWKSLRKKYARKNNIEFNWIQYEFSMNSSYDSDHMQRFIQSEFLLWWLNWPELRTTILDRAFVVRPA